jgi:hypothetical protein
LALEVYDFVLMDVDLLKNVVDHVHRLIGQKLVGITINLILKQLKNILLHFKILFVLGLWLIDLKHLVRVVFLIWNWSINFQVDLIICIYQ